MTFYLESCIEWFDGFLMSIFFIYLLCWPMLQFKLIICGCFFERLISFEITLVFLFDYTNFYFDALRLNYLDLFEAKFIDFINPLEAFGDTKQLGPATELFILVNSVIDNCLSYFFELHKVKLLPFDFWWAWTTYAFKISLLLLWTIWLFKVNCLRLYCWLFRFYFCTYMCSS